MSIIMAPLDYSISQPTGDDLYGNMMVGDAVSTPQYVVGDDQGMEDWNSFTWDPNYPANPFDTGVVPIAFEAAENGSEAMTVGTQSQIANASDALSSTIQSVVFQAGVTEPAEAAWSNISVQFFSGTTLEETVTAATGPDANTINTPNTPQAEQIMTITPSEQNITSVIVTGSIRLQAPAGAVPNPTGMFCNVYVFGANGSMAT